MNIAIITGASSGMGKDFALQINKYFQDLDEIWLVARRSDRLEELAEKLTMPAKVFAVDLLHEEQMMQIKKALDTEIPNVKVLINSSGFGMLGKFSEMSMKEQMEMIDLNCRSLTQMTYLCIPYMGKNSHILQMASSAAFLPQPNFAIYAATKSYVLSFSRALSEELREKKIHVTAVCPGPVRTEFFEVAERYGKTMAIKKLVMVRPMTVVNGACRAAKRNQKIYTCGIPMKLMRVMTKLIPRTWIVMLLRPLK